MKWFLLAPLEVIATVVAYITNPIIALFANEEGWLPDWAYWWQTYDNTLDVEWMITEDNVPDFAKYDYSKHYVYHYEKKNKDGTFVAGYVDVIDDNFTLKEKLQRYFCRLCWLYRNTNYGFSYYVNGVDVDPNDLIILKKVKEPNNEWLICYAPKGVWHTPWCIFINTQYCSRFKLRVYLGWKLKGSQAGKHMLALFVSPFRNLD